MFAGKTAFIASGYRWRGPRRFRNTSRVCTKWPRSGLPGWRPEKRGFGARARCVFGTWHVAGWIFGPKTRVVGGIWSPPCRVGVGVGGKLGKGLHLMYCVVQ